MLKTNRAYLGRGWSFPPTFDEFTLQNVMVADEEDIRESLRILFSTQPGERIMLPKYGCNLNQYLFKDIDSTLKYAIIEEIKFAIIHFEPRIEVIEIDVDISNYLDGYVNIKIDYRVIQHNTRHNIVFPFYLREGTYVNI